MVTSLPRPTKPTLAAVACKLVHLCVGWPCCVISARPNSTSLSSRPSASVFSVALPVPSTSTLPSPPRW